MRKGIAAVVAVLAVFAVIIFIALMGALWYFGTYNSLVQQRVAVDASWSEVQNQYQRRFDLIPQLVNSTKMYINYEKSVLTEVTALRSQWGAALASGDKNQQMATQGEIDSLANRLLVIANPEAYPQLKADTLVMGLMDELAGTQNRVAVARGRYILDIQAYNTNIRMFPNNIVAGMNGFTPYPNYTANTGADTNPTVPIG
jgi:LemA protein